MQRRIFIKLSAYGTAALSIPLLNSCSEPLINKAVAEPRFLSHIFDIKTMIEAGQAYIKQVPGEGNKNKLTKLLSEDIPVTGSINTDFIHTYMDNKVRQDFQAGKTIIVDGWILSVTEARQCALFSLLQNK